MVENQSIERTVLESLSAGVVHELNSPLTYTMSNVELLLEDINLLDTDASKKKYLLEDAKVILDGLHRMSNVVKLLHEASSKNYDLFQDIDIYTTLISALKPLYGSSKDIAKILINKHIFNTDFINNNAKLVVNIQESRIITLWDIIITNALDSLKINSSISDALLEIDVEKDTNMVRISFKDNGGGISKATLHKIFNTILIDERVDGGMGIGLGIAKKIVDDNSAEISVKNVTNGVLVQVTFYIKGG